MCCYRVQHPVFSDISQVLLQVSSCSAQDLQVGLSPCQCLSVFQVLTTLENSGNFLIRENSRKTPGILNLLGEFL